MVIKTVFFFQRMSALLRYWHTGIEYYWIWGVTIKILVIQQP